MPFETEQTEYYNNADHAAWVGNVMYVMESLTMSISDEFRRDCIDWMCECGPVDGVCIRTPSVLVKEGYKKNILEPLLEGLKLHKKAYPTGTAGAANIVLERLKIAEDKRHLLLDDTSGRFVIPPFNYETIGGRVRLHRWDQSDHDAELTLENARQIIEIILANPDLTPKEIHREAEKLISMDQEMYVVERNTWLPGGEHSEQREAQEYAEEVHRLQASPAGRKAKRLLLDNLTDEQEDDYFRKGYFLVTSPSEFYPNKQPRRYCIERGFPNGNIMSIIQLRAKSGALRLWPLKTFCFHSEEPYAMDDILLAQKLHIEHDEQDFLAKANMTDAHQPRKPLEQNLRTY